MQTQDHRKINPSGHGVYVCHKCGWPFPNPHPSAKHRRSHKKICGTIEGYRLACSEENKANLNAAAADDDDSKSPSDGLIVVKKAAEMTISRRSSSGVGNRSSRSDEDVFSDATADFGDAPAAAGFVAVRERAGVMQDLSQENDVAGDLYPPNSDYCTQPAQLQNVECSSPENERLESDMPSPLHLSSSTVDSISNSHPSVGEASLSESTLQCSKIDIVLDSEEKASLEAAALGKNSEDAANSPSENAGKTSEAVLLPQKANKDGMEFVLAGVAVEVDEYGDNNDCSKEVNFAGETNSSGKGTVEVDSSEDFTNTPPGFTGKTSEAVLLPQKANEDGMEFMLAGVAAEVDEYGDNNDCSKEVNFAGETNSSGKGTVEVDSSEDFTNTPPGFTGKTSEAVFVPQMVMEDNLEFLPANAVMEVIGKQGEEFDAKNVCFSEADIVGQSNSIEEDVEARSSFEMSEDPGSYVDNTHVSVAPDALTLKEFSEGVPEDYEDHKSDKLPNDLSQEAECVDHGIDEVNKEDFSFMSLAEPSKNLNQKSEQIISEALDPEDYSTEDVSVEKKMENHATDADIYESVSVVVNPDKDETEIGGGEMVTSPKEQNSLVFSDTNLHSVLDASGNLKPVHNDSEHDEKEAQICDALEADGTKGEEEKLPLTTDGAVDYDVRSREVEKNLSGSTPTVAQSDDRMNDKVEVQRDDEHGFDHSEASIFKLQDSETEVNDLGSSNQIVGGECVNLLGTAVISGTDINANMTEDTHFEENCVHKASDSDDVNLLNNAMNHDAQQDENEVFEDAKELQNFDEKVSGEECSGKVDLGLISDNDDDIDLAQNTANKTEARVHVSAVSAIEERSTEMKDGCGSGVHVQELDVQVDSVSQTDSLEGNWGSVSVLSAFSDAPPGTETGSQPSQSSVKLEKASLQPKSDIFKLPDATTSLEQKGDQNDQNEGPPEAQTSEQSQEKASESSGSKKNEEIIAKVTNWSTASGKQHMSLKSFLGDPSSPNAKDNPPLKPQETEKAVIMSTKTKDPAATGEMQKEWNSPARLLTNIKTEKGKVKSKSYWAPFICCSSSYQ